MGLLLPIISVEIFNNIYLGLVIALIFCLEWINEMSINISHHKILQLGKIHLLSK